MQFPKYCFSYLNFILTLFFITYNHSFLKILSILILKFLIVHCILNIYCSFLKYFTYLYTFLLFLLTITHNQLH